MPQHVGRFFALLSISERKRKGHERDNLPFTPLIVACYLYLGLTAYFTVNPNVVNCSDAVTPSLVCAQTVNVYAPVGVPSLAVGGWFRYL